MKYDGRFGRPKTHQTCENVENLLRLIRSGRNLGNERIRKILIKNLEITDIFAKMFPTVSHWRLAFYLLFHLYIFDKIIIGDEIWFFQKENARAGNGKQKDYQNQIYRECHDHGSKPCLSVFQSHRHCLL